MRAPRDIKNGLGEALRIEWVILKIETIGQGSGRWLDLPGAMGEVNPRERFISKSVAKGAYLPCGIVYEKWVKRASGAGTLTFFNN